MRDPIETTVDRLRTELGGLGLPRASVLTEVRDGLEDAAAAYAHAGLAEPDARRRAVTDFGDPDAVAAQYRASELGRRSQQTARALGIGSALVLGVWILWGLTQPGPVLDSGSLGFFVVTGLAVGSAGVSRGWTRSRLRSGRSPRAAALAIAVAVVALCIGSWVLSYAIQPWTTPAEIVRSGWNWRYAVEAVSAVTTAAMLATALRCLAGLAPARGRVVADPEPGAGRVVSRRRSRGPADRGRNRWRRRPLGR